MARQRMIKAQYWSDPKVVRMSLQARLLFIAMWTFADDFGVISASIRRLSGEVFESDDKISEKSVKKWVGEIEKQGMIVKFFHHDQEWYYIKNWNKHQRVQYPSVTTRNPEYVPPVDGEETQEGLKKDSRRTQEGFYEETGKVKVKVKVKDKVEVQTQEEAPGEPAGVCVLDLSFESFKNEYPSNKDGYKPGMAKALHTWSEKVNGCKGAVFKALEHYKTTDAVQRGFVMAADKFLETWTDFRDPPAEAPGISDEVMAVMFPEHKKRAMRPGKIDDG